jgi:dephospho-CoA kinase
MSRDAMRSVIVGLTGAVGAGKSTAAALLAAQGFEALDVDEVAAQAVRARGLDPGEALLEVLTRGPRGKDLEAAIAPEVERRVGAWCAQTAGPRVIDAALLFELGLDVHCALTICLRCPAEERRRRVEARRTISARHFEHIERAQLDEAEKARRATHVVWTDRPVPEVDLALRALMSRAMVQER